MRNRIVNQFRRIPLFKYPMCSVFEILKMINQSKDIYYASEFSRGGDYSSYIMIANLFHWKIEPPGYFVALETTQPSIALNAFLEGPTMADCGSVLQASVYWEIMHLVGRTKFDQLFSTTPLIISPYLFPTDSPLRFLYDDVVVGEYQRGDIVYVKGVQGYESKHLSGNGPGWHLFVDNQDLFHGFGREFTNGSKGIDEMRKLLIKSYNNFPDTTSWVEYDRLSQFTDPQSVAKVEIADLLKDDEKDDDYPIGGTVCAMRMNRDRLWEWVLSKS